MFADVIIQGPEYQNSLVIPEASLRAGDKLLYVRGGTLREHRPNILGRNPQGIVIDGFDSGEGIIIGTVSGISVGMPVATIPFMSQDSERP